jgi:hypothetical protein
MCSYATFVETGCMYEFGQNPPYCRALGCLPSPGARMQPVPRQGVERRVCEAMRQHDRLGDTERRTGQQP